MELGIALSSEEQSPAELVRNARAAEEAGLGFGLISDHIHPWVDAQGHSGFVWAVLGSIAQTSEGGGVAYMAHIGGFVAGLLLVKVFAAGRSRTVLA